MLAPILSSWFLIATLLYFVFDLHIPPSGLKRGLYEIATSPILFLQPIGILIGELITIGYMASTGNGPPQIDERTEEFCIDLTYYLVPCLSTMAGVICWMLG